MPWIVISLPREEYSQIWTRRWPAKPPGVAISIPTHSSLRRNKWMLSCHNSLLKITLVVSGRNWSGPSLRGGHTYRPFPLAPAGGWVPNYSHLWPLSLPLFLLLALPPAKSIYLTHSNRKQWLQSFVMKCWDICIPGHGWVTRHRLRLSNIQLLFAHLCVLFCSVLQHGCQTTGKNVLFYFIFWGYYSFLTRWQQWHIVNVSRMSGQGLKFWMHRSLVCYRSTVRQK